MSKVVSLLPEYEEEILNLSGYTLYSFRSLLGGDNQSYTLLPQTSFGVNLPEIEYLHELGFCGPVERALHLPGVSIMPQQRIFEPQNSALLEKLRKDGVGIECVDLRSNNARLAVELGVMTKDFARLQTLLTETADDKLWLRTTAESLGLSHHLVPGGCARSLSELKELFDCYIQLTGQVVFLDNPRLGGGVGFHKVKSWEQLLKLLSNLEWGEKFPHEVLLTSYVEKWSSPSIQWDCRSATGPELVGITMQLLNGDFDHAGNSIPSGLSKEQENAIINITRPFAQHLHAIGFRWVAGFDLIHSKLENPTPNGTNFYVQECNPRHVAPFYARKVQKQLQHTGPALMLNVKPSIPTTPKAVHNLLKTKGLLFGRCTEGCVVPYMTTSSQMKNPKFAVVVLGSTLQEAKSTATAVKRSFGDESNVMYSFEVYQ